MLPQNWLRDNLDEVIRRLATRGYILDKDQYSSLENHRKDVQVKLENLQAQRNKLSKEVGILKSQGNDATELLENLQKIKDDLTKYEEEFQINQKKLGDFLAFIPNIPGEDCPVGKDENDNVVQSESGVVPEFDFTIADHVALGEKLGLFDFGAAAKISGARFTIMQGKLAKLQRVLLNWMLEHQISNGYLEYYVPCLVRPEALFGTGQLPKFADDVFTTIDNEYALISTGEIPLTNLVRDRIIAEEELPLKYVAHTPCFRRESGSYGRDTKGIIRLHQFEKVEMVQIVRPSDSAAALQELVQHASSLLDLLELPYRVVNLCSGDLGFAALQTYDLEVFMAGNNSYREISSCSNFGDFQARRLLARWRSEESSGGGRPEYVHTLNGSGLPSGRTIVALLENYQNKDGSVTIPDVLRPLCGFAKLDDS